MKEITDRINIYEDCMHFGIGRMIYFSFGAWCSALKSTVQCTWLNYLDFHSGPQVYDKVKTSALIISWSEKVKTSAFIILWSEKVKTSALIISVNCDGVWCTVGTCGSDEAHFWFFVWFKSRRKILLLYNDFEKKKTKQKQQNTNIWLAFGQLPSNFFQI